MLGILNKQQVQLNIFVHEKSLGDRLGNEFYYKIRVKNLKQIRENDCLHCSKICCGLKEDWLKIMKDIQEIKYEFRCHEIIS
jgi:hypothetical protein